jgi:hypothetical protein
MACHLGMKFEYPSGYVIDAIARPKSITKAAWARSTFEY